MVDNSGEWRWSDFQHLLPVQVLLRLAATKAPSPLFPADEIGWGLRSNRQFSIKFAYDVRLGFAGGVAERIWRTIHDFRGLPKIKFFMWLACKGKLMTNVERRRRHLTQDAQCPVCHAGEEDVDHILHHCGVALSVWSILISPFLPSFLSMPLHQWFVLNLVGPFPGGCDRSSWDLLFAAIIWNLWCHRNASVFGCTDETWGSIIGRMQLNTNASRPSSRWFPPPVGWFKLNTDGACRSVTGHSSCGGFSVILRVCGCMVIPNSLVLARFLKLSFGGFMLVSL
ncbi:hypothetical protein V6N11_024698 [Hibiscus sabdariffa]|uniref:Reverse transcriptase zinc-binding domain-containing protein n=1 Tax=Hibiscus sabdariffa TaxID=183260 RepID=A0ABR2QMW2_9ROSI